MTHPPKYFRLRHWSKMKKKMTSIHLELSLFYVDCVLTLPLILKPKDIRRCTTSMIIYLLDRAPGAPGGQVRTGTVNRVRRLQACNSQGRRVLSFLLRVQLPAGSLAVYNVSLQIGSNSRIVARTSRPSRCTDTSESVSEPYTGGKLKPNKEMVHWSTVLAVRSISLAKLH